MTTYHHVLRRASDDPPVYIRLRPSDEWQAAAPDRYRVVGCPIPLGGHFCFTAADGARMCSVGPDHEHTDERQPALARDWTPSEIAP